VIPIPCLTMAPRQRRLATAFAACLSIAACGGEDNKRPTVQGLAIAATEDNPAHGQLAAKDPEGQSITFAVVLAPGKAGVMLDPLTGAFTYTPRADLNGTDSFTVVATDSKGAQSRPAVVTLTIAPVNDAPRLAAMGNRTNAAETLESRIRVPVVDVDGDPVTITASASDLNVATVATDGPSGELIVTPVDYGQSTISVSVTDGAETVGTTFDFSVVDVDRNFVAATDKPDTSAVTLQNRTDRMARFVLEHNDYPVFKDATHIVEHVRALPDVVPGEGFERKLWRFLRDATNHYYSLMPLQFRQSPWATLNSLGFGLCGDMATSYVAIARAAGYEARVWSLGGHVAPEIRVDGRWQLYDPDLGIFYRNRSGAVAGVEELSADPTLVTDPYQPIFTNPEEWPYSDVVADIYATAANNFVADATLLPAVKDVAGQFELPPGASLTYPGRWTDPPVAYVAFGERILREEDLPNWRTIAQNYDGAQSHLIPFHRQARLALADGWTGDLALPLWLWDVHGEGTVRIEDVTYTVGSAELTERLRYRIPARSITILESRNLSLIMQINFVRFDMRPANSVVATGRDVWTLSASTQDLGAQGAGAQWTYARAVATNP
jgi:Bacterial Ig domain/Transglutaminase-like superfamily